MSLGHIVKILRVFLNFFRVYVCQDGQVEDSEHFILWCNKYIILDKVKFHFKTTEIYLPFQAYAQKIS